MIFCRNFLSHSTKKIIGVRFSVSEVLWYRKNFWINRVSGISRVSVRNVLSLSAEKNRAGTFQCFTESGIDKFYALEG